MEPIGGESSSKEFSVPESPMSSQERQEGERSREKEKDEDLSTIILDTPSMTTPSGTEIPSQEGTEFVGSDEDTLLDSPTAVEGGDEQDTDDHQSNLVGQRQTVHPETGRRVSPNSYDTKEGSCLQVDVSEEDEEAGDGEDCLGAEIKQEPEAEEEQKRSVVR